jgi:hypothetical protein
MPATSSEVDGSTGMLVAFQALSLQHDEKGATLETIGEIDLQFWKGRPSCPHSAISLWVPVWGPSQ